MDRRKYLKTSGTAVLLSGAGAGKAGAFVPAYNWEAYDFRSFTLQPEV
jgi:hypothetical protein